MSVVWESVAWKSAWHHEQGEQTKSAVRREREGDEKEERLCGRRGGEAQLQPDRGPSTCGSPHRPACGRQRDLSQLLALLWSPRCCKALGCHPFVSPGLVSSPVFTQRCVCGCTRPALLGGALSGWFYQQDVGTISEKQDKNLGKAEVDIQVIANNVFLARIGNTAGRGAANKVINNALGIVYGPWTSVYGPCGLMA